MEAWRSVLTTCLQEAVSGGVMVIRDWRLMNTVNQDDIMTRTEMLVSGKNILMTSYLRQNVKNKFFSKLQESPVDMEEDDLSNDCTDLRVTHERKVIAPASSDKRRMLIL